MLAAAPVFTEATSCQDCSRCVRECPVKAIRVNGSVAQVVAEECLACGHCVQVCPARAKRVRDDLPRLDALLAAGRRVVVSLAPAWVAEFPAVDRARLVAALRRLGVESVSETARGAQQVSAAVAGLLEREGGVHLSSACPVSVDYLKRHRPVLGGLVTPMCSPMLVHARMLREHFGADIAVAFIGPCIAKKREADLHPELVDVALTFADLRGAFARAGIDPAAVEPGPDDAFGPFAAREGALYPVEGGMIAGIRADCSAADPRLASVSGLEDFDAALAGVEAGGEPLFVELLACRGGCINGPGMARPDGTLAKRARVIAEASRQGREPAGPPRIDTAGAWPAQPVAVPADDPQVEAAMLATMGKTRREDELNCGGCGYDTCRAMARAMAAGRAEPGMCVSYMRRLAQSKAHALLHGMPAAAVLVDERLQIVECNERFARQFADGRPCDDLAGAEVQALVPFAARFRHVLTTGEPLPAADLHVGGRVLSVSAFPIEAGRLAGAIIQDVTEPALERERVVARARAVIDKNLETVNRIAFLLGENAADTEGMLSSLIDQVSPGGARDG